MKRRSLLAAFCLLLVSCTVNPTPASSVERPTLAPSATLAPTEIPPPTGTLPATWTPSAVSTAQPTWTRAPLSTLEATEAPITGSWSPDAIPDVPLTPTPTDRVPGAAERAYSAAQSALAAGNLAQALERVDEALAPVPDHADFLALRGRVLIAQQHPLQGEADLRTALSYDPFNLQARQALADLYLQYGRWRDAEAEYERYLTLSPADPAGWFVLGTAREAQGKVGPAIAAYSETLRLDPAHTDSLRHRGDLWRVSEAYRAAWSDYTALLALSPGPELFQTRAEINLELDEPLLAAADFHSAISLTMPTGAPTGTLMIDLGRAYLAGGAGERAATVFSTTLSLTDTMEVRLLLGESYLATGILTDALRVFSEALPLAEPAQKAAVLIGQGRTLLAAGESRSAEETLGTALDFATTNEERAEILRWRSRAYNALEAYEKALADLEAAEELAPDPQYSYWRAGVYEASGQTERALEELTAFLQEVDPEQVDPAVIADAEARLAALVESP